MSSKENNNKRGRGPPTKEEQIRNKISRMEDSLKEAILKGNQKIVDNYSNYLDVLHKAAMGEGKVSPTNQISCAKVLIEKCEDILDTKDTDDVPETQPDTTQTPTTASLISLKAI